MAMSLFRFISEMALDRLTIHLNFRKHIRGEIENVCCWSHDGWFEKELLKFTTKVYSFIGGNLRGNPARWKIGHVFLHCIYRERVQKVTNFQQLLLLISPSTHYIDYARNETKQIQKSIHYNPISDFPYTLTLIDGQLETLWKKTYSLQQEIFYFAFAITILW